MVEGERGPILYSHEGERGGRHLRWRLHVLANRMWSFTLRGCLRLGPRSRHMIDEPFVHRHTSMVKILNQCNFI
jgi:hypothetical protein